MQVNYLITLSEIDMAYYLSIFWFDLTVRPVRRNKETTAEWIVWRWENYNGWYVVGVYVEICGLGARVVSPIDT